MPAAGYEGVVQFVFDVITSYGVNACPPLLVGVGVSTSVETAATLSKRAILRPIGSHHPDPQAAKMEALLEKGLNDVGIGPQGMSGSSSVMGVHIEASARHPSTIGVGVSVGCSGASPRHHPHPTGSRLRDPLAPGSRPVRVLTTPIRDEDIAGLRAGDVVYLDGLLVTCRDVGHRRLIELGQKLPVDLRGNAIFHAGPIVVKDGDGWKIISIGPTTSMRMESFSGTSSARPA